MTLIRRYTADDIARHDKDWPLDAPVYLAEDFQCVTLGRLVFTRDAFIPGISTAHRWIRRHTTGRLRRALLILDAAVYTTNDRCDARRIPFAWIAPRRPDAPPINPDDRRQWQARAAITGRLCDEPAGDGMHYCINPAGHAGYHATELDSCGGWRAEITWAAANTTHEGHTP